jgi:hypothetical protein
MYLYIEESILRDKSLSGSEKLVLALVKLLTTKGKGFFGGASYLAEQLGVQDGSSCLLSLREKDYVVEKGGAFFWNSNRQTKNYFVPDTAAKTMKDLEKEIKKAESQGFEIVSEDGEKISMSDRMSTIYIYKQELRRI